MYIAARVVTDRYTHTHRQTNMIPTNLCHSNITPRGGITNTHNITRKQKF